MSYLTELAAGYYYTCEADGTVRQWDDADLTTATEYLNIETVVTVDIAIYTKL